ncbi:MAG: UDP-GlcNAc:undecaprenyl-phosphate/decaprenyl-phosphate GlcNAc-phosphate transferase [Actinomycetota bacterium]|jgi:UDP-GlcNAc:undecaprenyl-phosphate GlcNAc-1-phosphate transferase
MVAAVAFLTAAVVSLFSVPWVRRVAETSGFVDRPADRKSHTQPVPYLGGIAISAAVLLGLLIGGSVSVRMGVAAMAAAGLGIVGLLDDDRDLPPRHRLLYQALAACVALGAGVQAHVTDVEVVDSLLTVVWIVGITNAINLLDNMDGLAGGTATVAGGAVAVLALAGDQLSVARLAAALSGACLGFLFYNRPPATIFMGDAGSLFLGFVLAVVVLEVDPGLSPPATFLVPLCLLALPVLDTTTVIFARMRRGRRVSDGGKDHLSHRLVKRGLTSRAAVGTLLLAEVILGLLAVVAGRAIVPLPLVALGALVVIGALSLATASAEVYEEEVVGLPVRPAVLAVLAGVVLLVLVVPAALAMTAARNPATLGAQQARVGLTALYAGDRDGAAAAFAQANRSLQLADRRLHGPLADLALAVPVLNTNLRSSRTVVDVSADLVASGSQVVRGVDPGRLRVSGGQVALDEVRRAAPALASAADTLRDGATRVRAARQPYLVPPLNRAVERLLQRLATATVTADRAAEAARLVPAILGGQGTRRYLLAIQNNAELRGTGGFIGNFGEVTAVDGRLRLERFGRFSELRDALPLAAQKLDLPTEFQRREELAADGLVSWGHINSSPDFPTAARLMAELYPRSGGRRVDGVIAVDPQGLAALLELTGPITVAGWPEPITAKNVVDVTLRDQYVRFEGTGDRGGRARREDFLGDVGQATWTGFVTADLGRPERIISATSGVVRQRHLQLFLSRPTENDLLEEIGASGRTPPLASDSLLVLNHNGGGNKTDYYLTRRFRYDVRLRPDGDEARVDADLDLTFRNEAPSSGLPDGVIGPFDERFEAGQNLSLLSIYSPMIVRRATVGSEAFRLTSKPELGRFVHAGVLDMPSATTSAVHLDLDGRVPLENGWYYLDIVRQPTVHADDVDVRISVPGGWKITDTLGLRLVGDREVRLTTSLQSDTRVGVRLERAGVLNIWDKLVG